MNITGLFDIGIEVSDKNKFLKDFELFLLKHDAMFLGEVEREIVEIGVDCKSEYLKNGDFDRLNNEYVNKFVGEEMGYAEEKGESVSIRLYISNEDMLEIWFDEENDFYTWSNASHGYEDTFCIVEDIFKWLSENNLTITNIETV